MTRTLHVPAASSEAANAALNEGLEALKDALRLPALEGSLEVDAVPEALFEALERWWAAYDRYCAIVGEALGITCTRGCTACCHDNPSGVSGVELLGVLRAAQGPAWLERARELAEEHQRALDEAGSKRAAQDATRRQHRPCMFLDEGGDCSVYAARPVACRMFVAVSEPAWCDSRHPRYEERTNPNLVPPKVLLDFLGALSQRLGIYDAPDDLRRGVVWLEQRLARRPPDEGPSSG